MTTAEIEEQLREKDKEINKVKSFCTRLAKALKEAGHEVPQTNWQEELAEAEEGEAEE